MRDMLLMLVFAWRAITAPFYPDPAIEIRAARQWLEQNVWHASQLTPALVSNAKVAGFKTHEVSAEAFRQLRDADPWKAKPVKRLYSLSKSVPSRPAWAVTDVVALIALDSEDRVLAVHIRTDRATL